MAEPRPSVCPSCGASFSCGVETGRCWCAAVTVDFEALGGKAGPDDGCLCPDCLREVSVAPDPLTQFRRWFDEARAAGAYEAEALALATATPDGAPSVRMVLGKGFDERGFCFFTNYGSRKAAELEANPRAALLFHWPLLGRQVRIEGSVERLPRDESEAYARTRSRASRLSALASPQSRPVPSRDWLEQRVAELAREHPGDDVPIGDDWGGYRLAPAAWEFWQHRPNRLHDRFRYLPLRDGGWRIERLGP